MKNKIFTLPRLDRKGKIVRNLVLTLAFLGVLWAGMGYPLPTAEMEFHRLERSNLRQPSDIQGIVDTRYERWVVASYQDQVILWRDGGTSLEYWPRAAEGATLVPVPENRLDMGEIWVVAADVPEGTASARLELTVRCWYRRDDVGWSFDNQAEQPGGRPPLTERWEKTYSAQGQLLEDGAVLFRVAAEEEMWEVQNLEKAILDSACQWKIYWMEQDQRDVDCHMEAVFYDRADRELGRAELATTEQGGAPWTGN